MKQIVLFRGWPKSVVARGVGQKYFSFGSKLSDHVPLGPRFCSAEMQFVILYSANISRKLLSVVLFFFGSRQGFA